jgi:hypothetical protein
VVREAGRLDPLVADASGAANPVMGHTHMGSSRAPMPPEPSAA